MIKTRGVAHFSIPVRDVARSEAFYVGRLGLRPIHRSTQQGMVFLDSGGTCIILVEVEAPISTAGVVNVHHSFVVDRADYAAARAELEAAGVEILFEEDRQGGAVNGPRFYFHDPDGNVLELIDLTGYSGAGPADQPGTAPAGDP